MKPFIGRKRELEKLHTIYNSNHFEFGFLYGRRRVGKTTLLKTSLTMEKNVIYWVAIHTTIEKNLERFTYNIREYFQNFYLSFKNFEELFEYLFSYDKKLTIIIDEFTYLIEQDTSLLSILQNLIDAHQSDSQLKIILSGSHMGLMESIENYNQPLYGRKTFTIKLNPFDYYESSQFVPNYSKEDKIRTYAIFGGMPYYLIHVNDQLSIKENIINLILESSSIFEKEPQVLLQQELRNITSYDAVLTAIANGSTKLSEITTKSQMESTSVTSNLIRVLLNLGLVKKEYSFKEKSNTKKTLYQLADHFFDFYYTYVEQYPSIQRLIDPGSFYDRAIAPTLDQYVSVIFEEICKEYLFRKKLSKYTSAIILDIGRYWFNNRQERINQEIDICLDTDEGVIVFECKWKKQLIGPSVINELIKKSATLSPIHYGIFSWKGFEPSLLNQGYLLYQLDDLFA